MKQSIPMMLALLVGLAACMVESMPEPDEGQRLFLANCSVCHGNQGQGSSRAGKVKAPDLTGLSQGNGGAFPLARVLSQIDGYGRGAVSSEVMPEFGALLAGDLVPLDVDGVLTPTPRPLAALAAYLESIQVAE